jgi:hypothetical protein
VLADCDLDVAVSQAGNGAVTWFEQTSSSTFVANAVATGPTPRALLAVDLDNDGDVDLVSGQLTPNFVDFHTSDCCIPGP